MVKLEVNKNGISTELVAEADCSLEQDLCAGVAKILYDFKMALEENGTPNELLADYEDYMFESIRIHMNYFSSGSDDDEDDEDDVAKTYENAMSLGGM